jgi:hypothetical protein
MGWVCYAIESPDFTRSRRKAEFINPLTHSPYKGPHPGADLNPIRSINVIPRNLDLNPIFNFKVIPAQAGILPRMTR